MKTQGSLVVTGQQIGVGWTPALSVVKALTALAVARSLNGQAVYWMADEDHDHLEVASTVGVQSDRIHRHRFRFQAPGGIATGWIPWTPRDQEEAEALWGETPLPATPTLKGHALALGAPLWARGLRPFSPTDPGVRSPIQDTLVHWRSLNLENQLHQQARRLEILGEPLVLDPRNQNAWFSLNPTTGQRSALEPGQPCPANHWLSPGAALRPLMQSLLLSPTHVVLGPAERVYWRLTEPLWERVGLACPKIIARPSLYVIPKGLKLDSSQLEALRHGHWSSIVEGGTPLPSQSLRALRPDPAWGEELGHRFQKVLEATQIKLRKLDRRLQRDQVAKRLVADPERLRQQLFPLNKPQERVLPGLLWLRDEALLDRMLEALSSSNPVLFVEAS
jgi:hypothetical protein